MENILFNINKIQYYVKSEKGNLENLENYRQLNVDLFDLDWKITPSVLK